MRNFIKRSWLRVFVGGLVSLLLFVGGVLFCENLKKDDLQIRKENILFYLDDSVEMIYTNLLFKLQQYQLQAYSAINVKLKELNKDGQQELLAWTSEGTRYSFFNKTNIEDIRFLTGGLYSDAIVPEGDELAYVLRLPSETTKQKLYMAVNIPGGVEGYLLSELDVSEFQPLMKQLSSEKMILDGYLVTSSNKIVLASETKDIGADLADVLVNRYEFFNANTLVKISGEPDAYLAYVENDIVHGVGWKQIEIGGRQFSVVVVGQDVSRDFLISDLSKNKATFLISLFFVLVPLFGVLLFRGKKNPEYLTSVIDSLPFASILFNRSGVPFIWNSKLEETFGISVDDFKKQLFSSGNSDSTHFLDKVVPLSTAFQQIEQLDSEEDSLTNKKKFRLKAKNKSRLIESSLQDLQNSQGHHIGRLEFLQDVTSDEELMLHLESLQQQYDRVVGTISEGVWLQNNVTGEFFLSARAKSIFGYSDEELDSDFDSWCSLVHKDDYNRVLEMHRSLSPQAPDVDFEYRAKHKDGHYLWIKTKWVSVWEDDKLLQVVACDKDISELKLQKKAFDVLYKISTANYLNNGLGRYLEAVHSGVASYTGVPNFFVALWREEISTFDFVYYRDVMEGDQAESFVLKPEQDSSVIPGLSGYVMRRGKTQLFHSDSEEMKDCVGCKAESWLGVPLILKRQPVGVITVLCYESKNAFNETDVQLMEVVAEQVGRAIERNQVHEHLYHQATHDNLTGLLNREHFLDWGAKILARQKRDDRSHALLMLDLNRFKQINDSLGHHIGDLVLIKSAQMIQTHLREVDTLARLGGDEFAVLLENSGPAADVIAVAKRIINGFKSGMDVDERHLVVGTSIGIVVDIEQYDSINDALRDADIAMYEAKYKSSQHFRIFNQKLNTRVQKNIEIEQILTNEFKADEFIVHYQPIIDLVQKKIAGFEALVRWKNPRLGFLYPDIFLPIAEESGTIAAIDASVLEQACQDLVHWQQQTDLAKSLTVSVNLSQSELIDVYLPQKIIECTERYNLDTSSLLIEITESALMRNMQMAKKMLTQLREDGVGVRIDDFGTGYSSLAHLADLPFDALKIDRSFLNRAEKREQGLTVLKTLVEMSKSLQMPVVAEGIESIEQLKMVGDLECRYGQGYYFSKPIRQDMVVDYIQEFSFS